MPELPEVETIKNIAEQTIGIAKIISTQVLNGSLRKKIPDDFGDKIRGATIVSYSRIAKYMVLSLDNGFSILWHFGMSGTLRLYDKKPVLQKHDHVVFETSKGYIVYNDPRRFGLISLCLTKNLSKSPFLKKIGLDPFDKDLSGNYLYSNFQKKKIDIKQALLSQDIVCGIGNIYASEILFDAKISPLRLTSTITKKECETLVFSIQKIINQAIRAGGSTLKDYKKPDGKLGYFQNSHCVYNKTGQKCPHCSCDVLLTGGIKKIIQHGRSTFYCERVQK